MYLSMYRVIICDAIVSSAVQQELQRLETGACPEKKALRLTGYRDHIIPDRVRLTIPIRESLDRSWINP